MSASLITYQASYIDVGVFDWRILYDTYILRVYIYTHIIQILDIDIILRSIYIYISDNSSGHGLLCSNCIGIDYLVSFIRIFRHNLSGTKCTGSSDVGYCRVQSIYDTSTTAVTAQSTWKKLRHDKRLGFSTCTRIYTSEVSSTNSLPSRTTHNEILPGTSPWYTAVYVVRIQKKKILRSI